MQPLINPTIVHNQAWNGSLSTVDKPNILAGNVNYATKYNAGNINNVERTS